MNFWFLVVSMIFVRSLDAYLTYLITPDLKFELNPLVSVGNQGWATLLSVNAFVVFFTLLLLYYSFNNSVHIYYPKEKNYTLKEFISFFLYNEKNSFTKYIFVFLTIEK
ncbi:MAG TPA: hypothetical protein PKD50_08470 [Leptospiraceae bacterium]|nr:hypothetical protein [Leptospiraceae bacterium]